MSDGVVCMKFLGLFSAQSFDTLHPARQVKEVEV
jgi:hypothetical protein